MINDTEHEAIDRRCLTVLLAGCAAFGWWGALYPQFTLVSGSYQVVCEAEGMQDISQDGLRDILTVTQENEGAPQEKCAAWNYRQDGRALYWQILDADRSQIRVKSRLLENWKALRGAGSETYESGD